MKTKWVWGFCLLLMGGHQVSFSQADKYWVHFADKADAAAWKPADALSQRSLERRERQGLELQPSDRPVTRAYIETVSQTGAKVLHASKWLNAVSVRMDATAAARVRALPFVREVGRIPVVIKDYDAPSGSPTSRAGYNSGLTQQQLEMVGLDKLHQNGYNGQGVLISVMDDGFRDADKNPHLAHLLQTNRIVATHDFVHGDGNVYDEGNHGQYVLSILAGWDEGSSSPENWFYGSAHGASFILCHTEDNSREVSQEEDNWVAAMEYADSIGADVFSTSLGYRSFDGGGGYTYADMDGNTTIITRAADMAASKGILVVNSAGNYGASKLLAPSDGDSVMSVGAVDSYRVLAGFSSWGPSADGRIKPDISAMGVDVSYLTSMGFPSSGDGTSFSCPIASGLAACLLQSAPHTPNMVLYDAIIRSSDRYANPDTFYGYGIPDATIAYKLLTGNDLPTAFPDARVSASGMAIYPNPATDHFSLAIDNEVPPCDCQLEVVDMVGRTVWTKPLVIGSFYNVFQFTRSEDFGHLPAGRYGLLVRDGEGNTRHFAKITLLNQR
ncbi:MAG: hypothetical protein RLZZ165_474 [Bacteroidota bacterium]